MTLWVKKSYQVECASHTVVDLVTVELMHTPSLSLVSVLDN